MTFEPVTPIDASTVILVKSVTSSRQPPASPHPSFPASPFLCFMVRRHVRSEFAADVFVFPGGKLDPADSDPQIAEHVQGTDGSQKIDGDSGGSLLSLKIAAIRELFEEAGVLLAERDGSALRFDGQDAETFARYRRELHDGRLTMLGLAQREGLTFDLDLLHPFSRWITPLALPRRYDTRFLIAELPDGQQPLHDAVETTEGAWVGPQEALDRYGSGDFPLVFATEKHLEQLVRYRSLAALIQSTQNADMTPITPRPVDRNGESIFLLPGEPGYEEADPRASALH